MLTDVFLSALVLIIDRDRKHQQATYQMRISHSYVLDYPILQPSLSSVRRPMGAFCDPEVSESSVLSPWSFTYENTSARTDC